MVVNDQQATTKTKTKKVYQHNESSNQTYVIHTWCSQNNNNKNQNTNRNKTTNIGCALHHRTAYLGRRMILYKNQDGWWCQ